MKIKIFFLIIFSIGLAILARYICLTPLQGYIFGAIHMNCTMLFIHEQKPEAKESNR